MPTALIAEDEPLLAQSLQAELARAWPALQIAAVAGDGLSAAREALRLRPDVLFMDIRMPGQDGLAAAEEIAERWPSDEAPMPQLVFVTAYDEYAARAFEAQALDYLMKPVQPQRLARTVARLQARLAAPAALPQQALAQWRDLLGVASPPRGESAPLKFIAASNAGGTTVRMVPVDEVLYFEAADKYVRVLTADAEHLIRTPLKQLLPQLDPQRFWQIHRAVVVRADAVDAVHRDETGRMQLTLRGRPDEPLPVSRLYAPLFRAM